MSPSVFNFISFQTPVEASNTGLSPEEQERPPVSPVTPHSASPQAASSPASPDQNCNSVRDLETAMSKHLPPDKSEILKHFYSRPGYSQSADGQFLPASVPAQPLAIKPYSGLEHSTYPGIEQNIYSHSAGFHLYNRGQTWYSGP